MTEEENRYAAFQGIKYAEDPIGELRFKPPRPFIAGEAVWDVSTNPKIACSQTLNGFAFGQEDCLILNVYVPESAINKQESLPVMFWIHGGGLKTGGSSMERYGPQMYMDREVVLVTINYRLGIFGFLSMGDEIVPGNAGFRDQNLALRWVNENIESFFGNSEKVTIFGESAGGESVSYHIISPMSRGLFRRAIMQSGTALDSWARPRSPRLLEMQNAQVFEQLGCLTEDTLVCLQGKSSEELLVVNKIATFAVIDETYTTDAFIPAGADELFANGDFDNELEVIIGTNKEDGMLMIFEQLLDPSKWQDVLDNIDVIGPSSLFSIPFESLITEEDIANSRKVIEFYVNSVENLNEEHTQQIFEMFTDATFLYGTYKTIKYLLEYNVPTYQYILTFSGQYSYSELYGIEKQGVCHADDIFYLFNPSFGLYGNYTLTDQDSIDLREEMTSAWTNFAKYGDPTPPSSGNNWMSWTPVKMASPSSFWNISGIISSISDDSRTAERMRFWDSLNLS